MLIYVTANLFTTPGPLEKADINGNLLFCGKYSLNKDEYVHHLRSVRKEYIQGVNICVIHSWWSELRASELSDWG